MRIAIAAAAFGLLIAAPSIVPTSMVTSAWAVSLASITATAFNTRGNSVLAKTLGAGVSFDSFSTDPTFVARTPTSTTEPSPADVILDTLGERAGGGTNLSETLF